MAACFVAWACGGFLEEVGRQRVGGLGEKRREVSVQPVSVLLDELLRCVRHLFWSVQTTKNRYLEYLKFLLFIVAR